MSGWVEAYEEMVDREDGALATERLRKLREGQAEAIPAGQIEQELGL